MDEGTDFALGMLLRVELPDEYGNEKDNVLATGFDECILDPLIASRHGEDLATEFKVGPEFGRDFLVPLCR